MEPGTPGVDAEQTNDAWFEEHFVELVQRYPGSWIAVLDRTVIAEGATKFAVNSAAKKLAGDREYSLYFIEPTALMY